MDWQPIETAPKDGDDVLLWVSSSESFDDPSFELAYWRQDAQDWDTDTGWLQGIPTHWMRPDPPKEAE